MKSWIAAAALAVLCGAPAQAQPQDQRWGGGWNQAPAGSYQRFCRDIRVNGDTLTASCEDMRGRWNYSSLRYRDCRGDIGAEPGTYRDGVQRGRHRVIHLGSRGLHRRDGMGAHPQFTDQDVQCVAQVGRLAIAGRSARRRAEWTRRRAAARLRVCQLAVSVLRGSPM